MNKLLLITGLFLLATVASVFKSEGAVIFQDNFDGYTVSTTSVNLPVTTTTSGWTTATNTTTNSVKVFKDSGNIFGSGTSNQYLQINRFFTSGSGNLVGSVITTSKSGLAVGLTGQYSFDFITDSSLGTSTISGYQARLGVGAVNSNGVSAFGIGFTSDGLYAVSGASLDGYTSLASLTAGQKYSLSVVYNFNSSSSYTYAGGTVAAGTMDIWLDTGSGYVLVGDDMTRAGGATLGTTLDTFGFAGRSSSNTLGLMSIDNVLIDSIATVPEPSVVVSFALGLVVLGIAAFRRKELRSAC